ncbi:hypothetical protein [Flaviflexus ciconiae]|nr:hypothetical protein [Flaviflexus ciconiae]
MTLDDYTRMIPEEHRDGFIVMILRDRIKAELRGFQTGQQQGIHIGQGH